MEIFLKLNALHFVNTLLSYFIHIDETEQEDISRDGIETRRAWHQSRSRLEFSRIVLVSSRSENSGLGLGLDCKPQSHLGLESQHVSLGLVSILKRR